MDKEQLIELILSYLYTRRIYADKLADEILRIHTASLKAISGIKKEQAIDVLERHNKCRRGDDEQMISPKEIGEAIDFAIKYMRLK